MLHGSRKELALLLAIGLFIITPTRVAAQSLYFGNWPVGASPKEVGKRVAENFVGRQLEFERGKSQYVVYPEVCVWYGSLTIGDLLHDQDLRARLIEKFSPLLTPEGANHISLAAHVDDRVFGVVPLELYIQTKKPKIPRTRQESGREAMGENNG